MSEYDESGLSQSERQDLRNSVRRGIRLLDRVNPSWFRQISLDKFNLKSISQCVLGQVYGGFFDGMKKLAQTAIRKAVGPLDLEFERDVPEINATYYGFNVPNQTHREYEYAGQIWVRAIQTRQAAAKQLRARKKAKR